MKTFTMFMIATLLAIGSMVGQTADFAFVIYDSSIPASPMGGNELAGASVELTDGVNTYSALSSADPGMVGFADFTEVLYGTYDYTVSKDGYITATGSFTLDASTMGGEMVTLDPYKNFAFVVYDSSIPASPMGGNELAGASVELTDGVNTYSALSSADPGMVGFADFTEVLYGTYDYTVSKDGYITATGSFTLDASTMGGEMVTLDPYKNFAFVVYDSSIPASPMGGNELAGASVELTDGVNTYSALSSADPGMVGFADFTEVLYGTYDYTVSKDGYITATGSFTVDASTMGGEMVTLDPYKNFAFVVYDSSIPASPMGGNELAGASVELTDGVNTYSALSSADPGMVGFADFTEVLYGTYDYTVSKDGYITATGSFTVDASTMGGEMVTLDPIPTSIGEISSASVNIFPNPTSDFINVDLGAIEGEVIISLINSNGGVVQRISSEESTTQVNVNGLSNGVYFINVSGEGFSETIKFVKK